MEASRFVSAEEIARELGVSRSTAYKVMHAIGRVRVGRVVRVERAAFERWLALHTEQTPKPKRTKRSPPEEQMALSFRREK